MEEEKSRGTESICMHPTSTSHTIGPVLHFANLYPGCWFRVFPLKKKKGGREKSEGERFFLSVCFHEQE